MSGAADQPAGYAGSATCRDCHARFYELWSTSRHGLAMQPYTPELAATRLSPQEAEIVVRDHRYRADVRAGVVVEQGPAGATRYEIQYVLGGKNVFYFLTLLDKGRLQTLPVAYDVNKKEWFDTAASGMRHVPDEDRAVHWKESPYTFNTSCYSCHVSQLSTNYDPGTDTYHTTWAEPGISCETCHGPSAEHNRIMQAKPEGQVPADPRIISIKNMTVEQRNDLCASCHAKAGPLMVEYGPGGRFFDHFDLVTLENPDYHPDGRDLGENYTWTAWRMSSCVESGQLDCMHCHTSSGRYRFKDQNFNDACMPCHADKVANLTEHTHHPAGSAAGKCIACHMPMTAFARMNRSDHSMLPPTPAATVAHGSPNACNGCHGEKDAQWADSFVRQWRKRDYQAPVLERAALIEAARKRDWSVLPEMLAYIQSKDRDEVFAASLIRLLQASPDKRNAPVLLAAANDPSPLVRAAAVEHIGLRPSVDGLHALVEATADEYRLVRTRAAAGLVGYPRDQLPPQQQAGVARASREYLDFIMARPDHWTSHYNMGNYHLSRGELREALSSYESAIRLEPEAVMAIVNQSIAYAQLGENDKAGQSLRKALTIAPENPAANFNMGLLEAERNQPSEAERYLKRALEHDAQMDQAAYNLCVLTAEDRPAEAVAFCKMARDLRPDDPRYGVTLAYYLDRNGDTKEALDTLNAVVQAHPDYREAWMLRKAILARGMPRR